MNRERVIAAAATIAAAGILLLWLNTASLRFDRSTLPVPPRPTTALIEEIEEYVDMFDPSGNSDAPAPAASEQTAHADVTPASATGTDISDAGNAATAPVPPASERPADVTAAMPRTEPVGPDRDTDKTGKARRRAEADTRAAFRNAAGKDNTSDRGRKTGTDAGRPDGTDSQANGTGMGTVGGGWHLPAYAKVPSSLTGSIVISATVDRTGHVTDVRLVGGDAPAAADAALVRACMAEVRSRVFTRSDDRAPDRATATITYRFR